MKTLNPPNYYMGSAYTFQGFIYPDTDFVDPDTPIPPTPTPSEEHKYPWYIQARKIRNRTLLK